VIAGLNARFASGGLYDGVYDGVARAGVFIRSFDGLNERDKPWNPCITCVSSDRFPSSLIYPSHTDIYSSGPGGFIIHPIAVSVFCSCYGDCGSQGKSCPTRYGDESCRPGCMHPCDPARGTRNWGCSWYGDAQLPLMQKQQIEVRAGGGYNEVVLDPRPWVAHLPTTIEAMFVVRVSSPQDVKTIKDVHASFLATYGLTYEDGPPGVLYDPKANPTAPFEYFPLSPESA
jgi:hypothetical protein